VLRIPSQAGGDTGEHGVPVRLLRRAQSLRAGFRLRKAIRFANHLAPLRMTEPKSLRVTGKMHRSFAAVLLRVREAKSLFRMTGVVLMLAVLLTPAAATTYYVSSSAGSDTNNGTSSSTPWQTIGHVNGQTFLPGDSILFKRGDVWNESLVVPSSGSTGNSITFDAYGTGAAPNLTGYYAVPATAWVYVTGNAWKAPVPATYTTINFCLFGSVWGQKVAAASANLTAPRNFYLANGFVYVYPL